MKTTKGIILAGGQGTRLYPSTMSISKQLLPVYDKPTIYYPLSVLMLAGIRDILVISSPRDLPMIEGLLGDGSRWGIKLSYIEQKKPEGIAQAFILGEGFIKDDPVTLILGDNIFYGHDIPNQLQRARQNQIGATIFAYHVKNPERYGVVEFDKNFKVLSIEEKPIAPKSKWVVTGLYFYDHTVCQKAQKLKPSSRGELEITDINKMYLDEEKIHVELLGRGVAWLDTGTHQSLLESSQFVQTLEERQGLKIACLEEIAYRQGYISIDQLQKIAQKIPDSSYGQYVKDLALGNRLL